MAASESKNKISEQFTWNVFFKWIIFFINTNIRILTKYDCANLLNQIPEMILLIPATILDEI